MQQYFPISSKQNSNNRVFSSWKRVGGACANWIKSWECSKKGMHLLCYANIFLGRVSKRFISTVTCYIAALGACVEMLWLSTVTVHQWGPRTSTWLFLRLLRFEELKLDENWHFTTLHGKEPFDTFGRLLMEYCLSKICLFCVEFAVWRAPRSWARDFTDDNYWLWYNGCNFAVEPPTGLRVPRN